MQLVAPVSTFRTVTWQSGETDDLQFALISKTDVTGFVFEMWLIDDGRYKGKTKGNLKVLFC